MVKRMWNLSKKPGVAKPEDRFIVIENEVEPFRKTHIFLGKIIPTTIIKDKNAYEITHIDESLYLEGFAITTYTEENIITCINLFGEHPNNDPNTNTYCLPDHKKGMKLDESFLSLLATNFQTYYYDSAYFIPDRKLVDYKKLKTMYIQLNQGDGNSTH
jgi:hypothetical protein